MDSKVIYGVALRLACAFCAFGIPEFAETVLSYVVVHVVEPGDGSLPGLGAVVQLYSHDAGGERWVGAFLLLTLLIFAVELGMIGSALWRQQSGFPVVWLVLGIVGLALRPLTLGGGVYLSAVVANSGTERLAALSIATQAAGLVAQILSWVLWLGVLVFLGIRMSGIGGKVRPSAPA